MVEATEPRFSAGRLADTGQRKVWLALLLAVLFPGLGQFYLGRVRAAVTILVLVAASLLVVTIPVSNLPVIIGTTNGLLYLGAIVHAAVIASRVKEPFQPHRLNNWGAYMLYLMIGIVLTSLPGQYLYVLRQVNDNCVAGGVNGGDIVFLRRGEIPSNGADTIVVAYSSAEHSRRVGIGRILARGGSEVVVRDNSIFRDNVPMLQAASDLAQAPQPSADDLPAGQTFRLAIPHGSVLIAADSARGWSDRERCRIVAQGEIVGKVEYVYLPSTEASHSAGLSYRLLIYYLSF